MAAGLLACHQSEASGPTPRPALAESRDAQTAFRRITERWFDLAPEQRDVLEAPLRDFLQRFAEDDLSRPARLYLAWILIQRREFDAARELVRAARSGPSGSVQDFASVTEAGILIRTGHPDAALALLAPLQGKIIDPTERLVFGEQMVQAALGGRRWRRSVDCMLDWIAEAPVEYQAGVQAAVERLLGRIPLLALEHARVSLDGEARATDQASARAPARDTLRKLILAQLVRQALDRRDVALARRLIDTGPPTLQRGSVGAELRGLASSGNVAARVAGRSVGLVLSLGSPAAQRRSAEVAVGLSRALGLPEAASQPEGVHLLTRDDGDGLDTALSGLAGDGAAILVAGLDGTSASAAATFAEAAGIPVIVLHHLPHVPPAGYAFVLGADLEAATSLLQQTLVAPVPVDCEASPARPGQARFPVSEWKRSRAIALIVSGDAECARALVEATTAARLPARIGLGLLCAEAFPTIRAEVSRAVVAIGSYPVAIDGSIAPDLSEWSRATGEPPSYYHVLGHDAGRLAAAALAEFPLESTRSPEQVTLLHSRARETLAAARSNLWSSDRPGFQGKRSVEREAHVVTAP